MMVAVAMLAPASSAQTPPVRSREAQHAIGEMIARCSEDQRQFFATQLTRPQYLVFCNCYVHSSVDAIDPDEQAYRLEHDTPSPQFLETERKLVAACIDQGRLRAPQ